jgi:hypothetical protein
MATAQDGTDWDVFPSSLEVAVMQSLGGGRSRTVIFEPAAVIALGEEMIRIGKIVEARRQGTRD